MSWKTCWVCGFPQAWRTLEPRKRSWINKIFGEYPIDNVWVFHDNDQDHKYTEGPLTEAEMDNQNIRRLL